MYRNLDRSFFRFITIYAFDRQTYGQTDGWTELSWLDRVCIPCSSVKCGIIAMYCNLRPPDATSVVLHFN